MIRVRINSQANSYKIRLHLIISDYFTSRNAMILTFKRRNDEIKEMSVADGLKAFDRVRLYNRTLDKDFSVGFGLYSRNE